MSVKLLRRLLANSIRSQLHQFLQQRLRIFQIARIKPFSEPAIDRSEKLASLPPLPLIAPEPRHAHAGAEVPGFCLLLTRDDERVLEVSFRLFNSGNYSETLWHRKVPTLR